MSGTAIADQALVAVTGWSVHLPGADVAGGLRDWLGTELGQEPLRAGAQVTDMACPPERAATLLGRKGLLYKEPATRLALCAVQRALGLRPGERLDGPVHTGTAVVTCSNFGNAETVAEVARTVATSGGRAVSPMAAPNASSNVISSAVALWFRFGGPNLMVCSGATAGLDALRLAALLLGSGRAQRVVVVAAEPDDDIASALYRSGGQAGALRAGASCVLLEPVTAATAAVPRLRMMPARRSPSGATRVLGPGGFDPAVLWGDCYGAQGVLQVALAATMTAGYGWDLEVVCGSEEDGWRFARVEPPRRSSPIPQPRSTGVAAPAEAGWYGPLTR